MGDREDEVTQLLQVIAAQPMHFDAHYQLGVIQHRRGLAREACGLLRRALLTRLASTGTRGCLPTVSPAPVTAQLIITSRFISSPPAPPSPRKSCGRLIFSLGYGQLKGTILHGKGRVASFT